MRVKYVDLAVFLLFPDILRVYRERYPGVDLEIIELSRQERREPLDRRDLDALSDEPWIPFPGNDEGGIAPRRAF